MGVAPRVEEGSTMQLQGMWGEWPIENVLRTATGHRDGLLWGRVPAGKGRLGSGSCSWLIHHPPRSCSLNALHALLDGPGAWKAPLSLPGGRTVQIGSALSAHHNAAFLRLGQLGRQKDTDGDGSWAWRNSNRGWRAHLSEAGLPCHAARASQ